MDLKIELKRQGDSSGPASTERRMGESFVRLYKQLALITFNTIVVLLTLNLALAVGFAILDRSRKNQAAVDRRVNGYRERFADLKAYSKISSVTAEQFLDEQGAMGTIGFQYEPWVQFRNPEFRGALLNTNSRGFRESRKPRKSDGKPVKVYVFGGSTTFGYGVPDDHTIPSYLQGALEEKYPDTHVLVRNFGQGFYYSSQEMLLLISLIKEGDIPDWAVFIDGGNDTAQLALRHDEPAYTPALKHLWEIRSGASSRQQSQTTWSWLPMARLAQILSSRLNSAAKTVESEPSMNRTIKSDVGFSEADKHAIAEYVLSRYTSNMKTTRSICKDYGIKCYFVWQPHPGYKYDRTLHKSFPFEGAVPEHFARVYSRMENMTGDDYLFLGDMLHGVSEKVFVDDVHYNEALNERIAEKISTGLKID
jgi:lysophospholipase L1-like esterase